MTVVGFLHPGAMGAAVAAVADGAGIWASEGRSDATAARAASAGLTDVGSLDAIADEAGVIVAICPPGAAVAQAEAVAAAGFAGTYVDANAIAPATTRRISALFDDFVDGGIVGPPVREPGTTRLYLSGPSSARVAALWDGSPLEVRLVDGPAGAASAVKMAFAAWTKGTAALLLDIRALAVEEGIEADLLSEWATSLPDLADRSAQTAAGVGPKAWRFAPEMREIAATFEAAGLPSGFHLAAAEIYDRLAGFEDADPGPGLADVVAALLAERSAD